MAAKKSRKTKSLKKKVTLKPVKSLTVGVAGYEKWLKF